MDYFDFSNKKASLQFIQSGILKEILQYFKNGIGNLIKDRKE